MTSPGSTSGRNRPRTFDDDVVHVGVALDDHEFVDPHGPCLAHAAEVVALEVDQHHVLGAFLGTADQLRDAAASAGRRRGRVPAMGRVSTTCPRTEPAARASSREPTTPAVPRSRRRRRDWPCADGDRDRPAPAPGGSGCASAATDWPGRHHPPQCVQACDGRPRDRRPVVLHDGWRLLRAQDRGHAPLRVVQILGQPPEHRPRHRLRQDTTLRPLAWSMQETRAHAPGKGDDRHRRRRQAQRRLDFLGEFVPKVEHPAAANGQRLRRRRCAAIAATTRSAARRIVYPSGPVEARQRVESEALARRRQSAC